MEKLNEKMTRFVELSKKFSKGENDISEVIFVRGLVNTEISRQLIVSEGLGATTPDTSYLNSRDPYKVPEDIEKKLGTHKVALTAFEKKYKVYEEYMEYKELQSVLDQYFKAEQLLME